jgi:stage II sporulation protein D
MEAALEKAGTRDAKGIISIEIESKNKSNRINNLIIKTAAGSISVAGKDFRLAIGPNKLRSNNYDVKIEGGQAYFNGIGWGHGAGMCQWGAYFMAKKGYKAQAILDHYYPGAKIEKK